VGTSFFIIGLSKKVLLADPLADAVKLGFAHPTDFPMFVSWLYALAYSAQLYFDFSGYSDMAIGLAYMFGIRFPVNFDSPYKATSIIDFWQRWHITLTRYLNLLLYNPIALRITRLRMSRGLGVSRRDNARPAAFAAMVVVPIFATMILAGVWHGAGLQFLIWGLMHACYLTINHAWRVFGPRKTKQSRGALSTLAIRLSQVVVTYVSALAAQVMFRASSVKAGLQFLAGMTGLHGVDAFPVPMTLVVALQHLGPLNEFLTRSHHILRVPVEDSIPRPASLALRFFIIWALPNSQTIMAKFSPTLTAIKDNAPAWLSWQPNLRWALTLGGLLAVSLMCLQQTKVFLYFQF
jgi:D-alanyl-lipoteichoic acid acyltransferase DltB (MBOAT superfamily)